MARGQIGGQIIKRAMPLALSAAAIGFTAGGESLDVGGAEQIGWGAELAQEGGLAVAQGESGSAAEFVYLSHL